MNKPFREVKDLVKRKCKVILAGIVFTLFGAGAADANVCNPVFESVPDLEGTQELVRPVDNGVMEVVLSSTSRTTKDKLDEAFVKFSQETHEDVSELLEPFQEIAEGMSMIKAEKVSIDGDPSEGRLNVAFRLPDGMVLSLNKKIGLHDRGSVGFNLMHNRRLIISDIMEVSLLSQYISNVQKRLG